MALFLTLVPGIDTTLVLRTTFARGFRPAVFALFGICLGLFVWGSVAALGAAALLAASELAYRLLTVLGCAYMVFLGGQMLYRSFCGHSGVHNSESVKNTAGEEERKNTRYRSDLRFFMTGCLTNLLNPKAGVFYLAAIPQFTPHDAHPLASGLLLAAIHAVISFLWLFMIVIGANYARRWLQSSRKLRIIDAVSGAVIVAFGIRLFLSSQNT